MQVNVPYLIPFVHYRHPMRTAAALVVLLLPVLAACSPGATGTAPSPTPTPSSSVTATTPVPDLTSAPTTPPTGELLRLDQAADYDDGLGVQVDNVRATSAPAGTTGAEGTSGQVVLADVVITNHTAAPYDATTVVIQGYYRGNVGAVMLSDPSGGLGQGFAAAVPVGAQRKARVGFAIPTADAGNVTIVVDPRDGNHNAVRFQGSAVGK